MRKFRYKIINSVEEGFPFSSNHDGHYIDRLTQGLDELGDESWQFCGTIGNLLIFKREYKTDE